MNYVYILIAAMLIAAIILVIFLFLNNKKRVQNSQKYLQRFTQLYSSDSVVNCLAIIRDEFSKGSAEYIAIDKAIYYLTKSIIRDYATAFVMIEKVFKNQGIKSFHDSVIEKEKANIILMLQ